MTAHRQGRVVGTPMRFTCGQPALHAQHCVEDWRAAPLTCATSPHLVRGEAVKAGLVNLQRAATKVQSLGVSRAAPG